MAADQDFAFVPLVDDASSLHQLMARAAFYFEYLMPNRIVIGVSDRSLVNTAFSLPDEMGERAAEAVERLRDVFDVRYATHRSLADAAMEADHIMRWDATVMQAGPWKSILRRVPGRIWGVDRFNDRMEGSIYIQAAHESSDGVSEAIAESQSRFDALSARLGRRDRAYLLATGPSISAYRAHNFSDGLVVACNTVILDDDLMRAAAPDIVVFADPIFHFGCSRYAAEFRSVLARRVDEYGFDIVIPIKYYEHFLGLMPDLADRTIGVPMGARRVNLDLRSEFKVLTTDNVASLLMIPLGCTFADDLHFLGFDGRSQGETYFWKHGAKTQLSDPFMENIKVVHPSFFSVDYEDYYSRHTGTLERMFWQGEMLGHNFKSLEASHIPALRRRSTPSDVDKLIRELSKESSFTLLSINPDLENRFGHFFHFDERLRIAAESLGGRVISIGNRAWDGPEDGVVPWFTDHTWNLLRDDPGVSRERFRAEFEALLRGISSAKTQSRVGAYLYTGSYVHLAEILAANLESETDSLPTAVNLFYSHKEIQDLDNERPLAVPTTGTMLEVTRDLAKSLNVSVFGDSSKFIELMEEQCGIRLPRWPFFSTTDLPELPSERDPHQPLRVYAPGNLQLEKGYDLVAGLSEELTDGDLARRIQLVARVVFREGTDRALTKVADRLRLHATVLEGELSDEEYIRQLLDADIILVPYRRRPFQTRTSGVVSDAVSLGKPVVATRDTWPGDIVERFELGATFEDGDLADMVSALERVADRYDYFVERAREAAPIWRSEASSLRLLTVVKETTVDVDLPQPTETVLEGLRSDLVVARRLCGLLESRTKAAPGTPRSQGEGSEKKLRERIGRLEGQVRTMKESAAYRWAARIVSVLQRVPFLYPILRRLARITS